MNELLFPAYACWSICENHYVQFQTTHWHFIPLEWGAQCKNGYEDDPYQNLLSTIFTFFFSMETSMSLSKKQNDNKDMQ